jgi:hypothetical protein
MFVSVDGTMWHLFWHLLAQVEVDAKLQGLAAAPAEVPGVGWGRLS